MLRLATRTLLCLTLVAAARAGAQQDAGDSPRPIPLDEAVRQAQANSPQTVQARGAARVANANFKSAVAAFLPSVTLGEYAGKSAGSVYIQGVLINSTSDWNFSKGYNANLTIFDGGSRFLQYREAKASSDAAAQAAVVQAYAIALQVKQQYFAVLAAREAEAAAEQQLTEANAQLEVTEAKLAGGSASRADSLNSAVTVGQARLAVLKAQGALVTANTSLTRLVGGDHELTAVVADTAGIPAIGVDSASLLRMALEGPAVQQATRQAAANRSAWWMSLTRYLPSIGMGYSWNNNFANPNFILGGGSRAATHSTSLYISYSLFDNFRREANVVTADANADAANATLRDARLAARENLAQYLATFRTAAQTIDLQRLQIEAATENVAAKDAQYRAGAVGLVDVLTAQTALAQARQALIQARLDARTAKAQIEALIGKNLD